ncbi:MAG: hypothetical protein M3126_00490 [Candidatus Eremiobacteraeota bacterium]|nr:hypothetical protein [Candidatus Eremiobacteraeota bacterium]
MNVRFVQLFAWAAVLGVAGVLVCNPVASEVRTVAVLHFHPNAMAAPTAAPAHNLHGETSLPAAGAALQSRPKTAPSLRPVLPRWLHRRHLA